MAVPAARQQRRRTGSTRSKFQGGVVARGLVSARAQLGLTGVARPRPVMALLFCAAVGILGWQVLAHSLAAYLARVAPATAAYFNRDEPTALLQLADRLLAELPAIADGAKPQASATPVEAEVRGLVERALRVDPLNAHGLALLAELAERQGNKARARTLLEATVGASQHEAVALYRLALAAAEARDFVKSVDYIDTLVRTEPAALAAVRPLMVALAEDPEAVGALTTMLGRNPTWRGWFLGDLASKVKDPRTPQTVLLGLNDTPHPPTPEELSGYLGYLVHNNLHGMAYYTWLQFTPPEHFDVDNLLFNGNFARKPNGLPFDWVIRGGEGVTTGIVSQPTADGQRGLNIEFGSGRVRFAGVHQVMVLSPGRYEFTGQFRGQLIGRRGTKWRVTCEHGGGTMLGETPMLIGTFPNWQPLLATFTVPESGCGGQILQLTLDARSASEQIVQGGVWYNDLRIVRKNDN